MGRGLLEDLFSSPHVNKHMEDALARCVEHQEFAALTVDGTVRCAMGPKDQASCSEPNAVRNKAAFGDGVAIRRVLGVRGRTGALLFLAPSTGETSETIRKTIMQRLPRNAFGQVRGIGTGAPSGKLCTELRSVLPGVICVYRDPVHLVIVYQHAHAKKSTSGLKLLRRIMNKVNKLDPSKSPGWWGAPYTGAESNKRSAEASYKHAHNEHGTLNLIQAKRVEADLSPETPCAAVLDILAALASLTAIYWEEVKCQTHTRIGNKGATLAKVLANAGFLERSGWYFNNLRFRHSLPAYMRALLPSGTSGTESIHREVNGWL